MIAVAGGKGGCGKTTTSLGLVRALADGLPDDGPDPVAVDADWDLPNLHALADAPRDPTVVDGDAALPDGRLVLPAPREPTSHDPKALLSRLGERVDRRVLLDCPAGAGPDAAAPLAVADRSLLVSTLDPPALRDAAKTAAMARTLDCAPVGVVLVRTDRSPAAVRELLDCPVLGAVPAVEPPVLDDRRVRDAYRGIARRLVAASRSGDRSVDTDSR